MLIQCNQNSPTPHLSISSFAPDILRKVASGIEPTPDAAPCPI
ncbi:hypothetical protein LCGC14_1879470, partial [marine sediment metagenome]